MKEKYCDYPDCHCDYRREDGCKFNTCPEKDAEDELAREMLTSKGPYDRIKE